MRKFDARKRDKIVPVYVYLDSIRTIVGLLTEFQGETNVKSVVIKTDKADFDNVDDLKNFERRKIHQLDMTGERISKDGKKEQINVIFKDSECEIVSISEDREAKTIVEDIRKELLSHKHPLGFLTKPFVPLLVPLTFFLSAVVISTAIRKGDPPSSASSIVLFTVVASVIAMLVALNIKYDNYSTVVLKYKDEEPTLWTRKKDDFIVNAIVSAISLAIGIALGMLIQKYGIHF